MKHISFSNNPTIAILIKESYFNQKEIEDNYVNKLSSKDIIAFSLAYDSNNKVTATQAKNYLNKLLPSLIQLGVTTLYVADSTYFKVLTKEKKAEQHTGYVLPCKLKGFEHLSVIYGVNYAQLVYSPNLYSKLDLTLETLENHLQGKYQNLGDGIIHQAVYDKPDELNKLLSFPMLSCDIETTGLNLGCEMVSIAFATDKHNGIAFDVTDKSLLKRFFEKYQGHLIFHNASFDVKQIIYQCFMKHPSDWQGLLHGVNTMYRKLHDTKIIVYLATNNTQGNTLGLKDLSHEFTGNYAVNVKDITKVEKSTRLEYNLKDCLATWYVFDKYYPKMLQDNQKEIYETLMLPSLKTLTYMEIIGMPVNMAQVYETRDELRVLKLKHENDIYTNQDVINTEHYLRLVEMERKNAKLKTKQLSVKDIKLSFNPSSVKHLQELLYNTLELPILDLTDNKQPATGTATLQKLMNHTDDDKTKKLLNALIGLNQVDKILSTFIPALLEAKPKDGHHYLHGSFNLGGTLSGRLSSSNPNLQNLPSGSVFGKLIKKCFQAPKGFIFCGSDFASLEDRINALLTKDENKLKVYTDGFDGHSLRAYYYWKDKMPDIRQATSTDTCYSVEIDNQIIYFKGCDTIRYQDKDYTGDEFYELVAN